MDQELPIEEVIQNLSERGRVEWDLAVTKVVNRHQQEQLESQQQTIGSLTKRLEELSGEESGNSQEASSDRGQGNGDSHPDREGRSGAKRERGASSGKR